MSIKYLDNKKIFITGITGSLGTKFTELLKNRDVTIIGYSRDEEKQYRFKQVYKDYKNITLLQGDVRDKDRLFEVIDNSIDIIIHAAALKAVPECELYPFETCKTNIVGAQNIINAAINAKVRKVIGIGTDKNCKPINIYGYSKAVQEKLMIGANFLPNNKETLFSCVRYGNVMNSRGSVIPLFMKQASNLEPLTITDKEMTRFLLKQEDACNLVFYALEEMKGKEIFVMKPKSCTVGELAIAVWECLNPKVEYKEKIIGIRAGEKIHEELIGMEESVLGKDLIDNYFVIYPLSKNTVLNEAFSYNSFNAPRLTKDEIQNMLKDM